MDVGVLDVPADDHGRLTGEALRRAIDADGGDGLFAVVASAGATNAGTVDDLDGVADVCAERGLWFHVDGAYGGAGLLAPSVREALRRASSARTRSSWIRTSGCSRPTTRARCCTETPRSRCGRIRQEASYLDTSNAAPDWNPADYAYHLSRRARGLPLWFSLATYGTDAYRQAVEAVLTITRQTAGLVNEHPKLELIMEPELSVVLFRRLGWEPDDYEAWWRRLVDAQIAFVQPTSWKGEKVARLCFVNPRTTLDHVRAILGTMS